MSKRTRKNSLRSLIVPLIILGVILSFALSERFLIQLFTVLVGNEVYAVSISYDMYPIYVQGQTSLKFIFDFNTTKVKAPIETLLTKFNIEQRPNSHVDISKSDFSLRLPVLIFVGDVQAWNRKTLFEHTFTFTDWDSRTITIYLLNLNSQYHDRVYVEIAGSYTLGDLEVSVEAGAVLEIV